MLTSLLLLVALVRPPRPAPAPSSVSVCEASWFDSARNRAVPVRIRIPAGTGKVPVILFSHGLGGSLDAGTTWAEYWAANGFAVIHMQHPGSDREILASGRGRDSLAEAMSAQQLLARVQDASFVLSEIPKRHVAGCDLWRIDVTRAGIAGHSFGAHTTQALAGQTFLGHQSLRDPRFVAAIAFSPAPPQGGSMDAARTAFASVAIPFFSVTGSDDALPNLTSITPEQRTWPFLNMPAGRKYLLVFKGGQHADFSGGSSRLRQKTPDPHLADAIEKATLAFWKATLLNDQDAQHWLDSSAVQSLLVNGDRFEHK